MAGKNPAPAAITVSVSGMNDPRSAPAPGDFPSRHGQLRGFLPGSFLMVVGTLPQAGARPLDDTNYQDVSHHGGHDPLIFDLVRSYDDHAIASALRDCFRVPVERIELRREAHIDDSQRP
jgi:hypothetical protein